MHAEVADGTGTGTADANGGGNGANSKSGVNDEWFKVGKLGHSAQ